MNSIQTHIVDVFFQIFQFFFRKKKVKKRITLNSNYNVLLILKGSVSDALMTTPFIKILQQNSKATTLILTNKKNTEIFNHNFDIEKVFNFSDNIPESIKLLYKLKIKNFDVIINLNEEFDRQTSLIIGLLKTNYKIGFSNITPKLLTHPIENSEKFANHKVDRLLKLTEAFDFIYTKKGLNIFYETQKKSDENLKNFLHEKNVKDKLLVCINISTYEENKINWKTENYIKIVKYLSEFELDIIVTSSIYDIELAEKISVKNSHTFYNTDFDEYAALIKYSDFIFTPDSFTVHLAAAFKKPVFILFNEGDEMLHVPYNSDFDFVLNEKDNLSKLSYGKVLNSFIPYFEYVFERYGNKK